RVGFRCLLDAAQPRCFPGISVQFSANQSLRNSHSSPALIVVPYPGPTTRFGPAGRRRAVTREENAPARGSFPDRGDERHARPCTGDFLLKSFHGGKVFGCLQVLSRSSRARAKSPGGREQSAE